LKGQVKIGHTIKAAFENDFVKMVQKELGRKGESDAHKR